MGVRTGRLVALAFDEGANTIRQMASRGAFAVNGADELVLGKGEASDVYGIFVS